MNIADFKILFIHGYTASSHADFYPTLVPRLNECGADYVIPDLPGERHPHIREWLSMIHTTLEDNIKPLVMVAHSLGTRAALLYIEEFQQKVDHLFLIAPLANRLENAQRRNKNYSDFFSYSIDVTKIKKLVNHSYVLHSKDDHSIPIEQGEEISRDINAELIVSENRDHFSEPTNAKYIFSILTDRITSQLYYYRSSFN